MDCIMREFEIEPYVKYVVLKIDAFETTIIDERNFNYEELLEIARFKREYKNRDDCIVVKVNM